MKLLEPNGSYDIHSDTVSGVTERKEINLNIIPGTASEYVPLFCMNKLPIIQEGYPYVNYLSDKKVKSILKEKYYDKSDELTLLDKYIGNYIATTLYSDESLHSLKVRLSLFKDIIHDYINDKSFHLSKAMITLTINNYEDIFKHIQTTNHWYMGNLRASNYLLNLGFLATYNVTVVNNQHTVDFQPLFSFVVKADDIKYLRLCYLTGKPIDTSVLELWMLKGFEDKDTPYKLMKMNYKKYLKEWVTENQIKVVEKENLTSALFTKIEQPALKTIKDRANWLNDTKLDFFKHLNFKTKLLENRGITLDYDR